MFDTCPHFWLYCFFATVLCGNSFSKRSKGIKANTFRVCFLDAMSSVRRLWMPFGVAFGNMFHEKWFRKWFQQKIPFKMETTPHEHVQRLPEMPPRVRTSQARSNSSSTNSNNCCWSSRPVFEIAVWICLHGDLPTKYSETLFELASIADVPKKYSKEVKNIIVKSTLLVIWGALGQVLANYIVN